MWQSRPGYLRFFLDPHGEPVVEWKEYATVRGEVWKKPSGLGLTGRVFVTPPPPDGPTIRHLAWREEKPGDVERMLDAAKVRAAWSHNSSQHWRRLLASGTLAFRNVQPPQDGQFGQSAHLLVDGCTVNVRLLRQLPEGCRMWQLPASATHGAYLLPPAPQDCSRGVVGAPRPDEPEDIKMFEVECVLAHRCVKVCCEGSGCSRAS